MAKPTDRGANAEDALADDDVEEAFRSILEGIRTTLPGIEAIFAFLLIVPFQSSFADIGTTARTAYYIAFVGSALASVLLIAPSAHQRLRATATGVRRRSPSHLILAVRLTIAGTAIFAISMAAAVFLVTSLTFSNPIAAIPTTVVAAAIGWSWFFVPLVQFRHDGSSE